MGLEKGKHVFCEKPPALNYDELLQVKDTFSKVSNQVLIYGFNHRQYDSIQTMKSIIDDPETGNILWMRGRYGKAIGDPNTQGWRSDPSKSGGGILLDQGIHMLDLMIYFGGNFDKVQSVITNSMWNIDGIEDNAFLNLYNSEKNIAASLHSTMIEWRHIFSLEVLLETGYLALNGLKTPSGSYGKEVLTICNDKHNNENVSESTMLQFNNNKTWEKEIRNFLEGVYANDGRTNLPDALEVMRVIKEAYNGRY
jgi:predicted dehydrogenase